MVQLRYVGKDFGTPGGGISSEYVEQVLWENRECDTVQDCADKWWYLSQNNFFAKCDWSATWRSYKFFPGPECTFECGGFGCYGRH